MPLPVRAAAGEMNFFAIHFLIHQFTQVFEIHSFQYVGNSIDVKSQQSAPPSSDVAFLNFLSK